MDNEFSRLVGDIGGSARCHSDECEALLIVVAAIPVGSFIVSGSIVLVGNTVHWLEQQGRCDDGVIQTGLNKFLNLVTD